MSGLNPLVKTDDKDFSGLQTNSDPRDLAAGAAQEQINAQIITDGQLQCRLGNRPVSFSNGSAVTASAIWSLLHYSCPNNEFVIYQAADGKVRTGKNLT